MTYVVRILPSTLKDILALPKTVRARVQRKIDGLASDPRPAGAKALKGERRLRIRVGDYRIIYEVDDGELIVLVVRVGHRREVYD